MYIYFNPVLTLDANGNLSVHQSTLTVGMEDVSNSRVLAEGTILSEGEKKTFVGAADYWVIPFDGNEPSFHITGGSTVLVIKCDCSHVEGHATVTSDCNATATKVDKGTLVRCDKLDCQECKFNTSSIVSGNVLVVSHPSINALSLN